MLPSSSATYSLDGGSGGLDGSSKGSSGYLGHSVKGSSGGLDGFLRKKDILRKNLCRRFCVAPDAIWFGTGPVA